MEIRYVKYVNKYKGDRVDFLLNNYDYIDGNDLIAKILHDKQSVDFDEAIDGIWFRIIALHDKENEYKLVWHEDVGNYAYSETSGQEATDRLEELLKISIAELNSLFDKRKKEKEGETGS